MVHVTCDLCGKEIRPAHEQQYIVKIEIYAVHDPDQLLDTDLDEDNLEAVSQLLCGDDAEAELAPQRQTLRYDLCADCRGKFVKNPLQIDAPPAALPQLHCNFSQN
jgi:hypothetical protein